MSRLLAEGAASAVCFAAFEGKGDRHRQLERKLRGYQNREARFTVIRDQDPGDCPPLKRSLAPLCHRAGRPDTIVAIACRGIEAF